MATYPESIAHGLEEVVRLRVMAGKDKAEIERLTRLLNDAFAREKKAFDHEVEIERLTAMIQDLLNKRLDDGQEIERVRTALKEVARCHACPVCRNRARHALGALEQRADQK